ncbi:MAG: neutral zinc metallopeptidase [Bradymonadaceae bacterium]|nr:neutral zinc metallopeptidase [Lujinxingiaceae bacterium]
MDIGGKKRSDNFEDRGAGSRRAGGGGGGIGVSLFSFALRKFGFKGALVAGLALGGVYFLAPEEVRQSLLGDTSTSSQGAGKVCEASPKNASACDFSRVVLASTEDAWLKHFSQGGLPDYGRKPNAYQLPTLVVFTGSVSTAGCGNATSAVGPFYCPADNKLYIDPGFYDDLAHKLKAPGDFAQAYVIAHEVGHHVQHLIGSLTRTMPGETKNQVSVRVELQADCFAGVWGHHARTDLAITDKDLSDATQAAHSIGDDALGHKDEAKFSHGSSQQRISWFKKGFKSGDPRQCDTFAVKDYKAL